MNFESFFKELTSEEQWFENVSLRHKPETFKTVCKLVWTLALADANQMKVTPMSDHRRHVVYKLSKILPDKDNSKQWFQLEEEKKEVEAKKEWVPLTGEARAKKLAEVKAIFDSLKMVNNVPRLTAKEIIESGAVRIPKTNGDYHRSVVEQMVIAKESKARIRECRRKFFLDAFPDASDEEIHAYWQQFNDTKDEAILDSRLFSIHQHRPWYKFFLLCDLPK